MLKFCTKCGNKLEGNPAFCPECGQSLEDKKMIPEKETKNVSQPMEYQPSPGQIRCPFCSRFFYPSKTMSGNIKTQKTTSTGGNIARGAIFLPWGVIKAVTNKKFIICPYCKMKIIQG